MLLGEILVEMGKVSAEQLTAVLDTQKNAESSILLGEILVEQGIVTGEDVLLALGKQYHAEVITRVTDEMLDPELVRDLPVEWARSHHMLPVRFEGGLAVLTCDPARVADQDDLSLLLDENLIPLLTNETVVRESIERCYFSRRDTASDFIRDLPQSGQKLEEGAQDVNDLLRTPGKAPVTQLINLILIEAVKARASDVHIEPLEDKLRVRYRIDGVLYEQASPPKHLESALVSRLKVMGGLDIAEKRLPQDGMTKVRVGEREIDIRLSTIPIAAGERVVLRLLNRESVLLPLAELGMPQNVADPFCELLREAHGAIWVTGPTGSGKTTTLYAALQELDTARQNVLTIEDPIEYQLPDIGQIAVKPKIGLTFSHGLRHILRQDPDVILVGETRDLETAQIAVRASLTGHLVFSTLHTNDASSAVIRLIDMGIAPYLLSAATRAVLAQRLVRRLCPDCRKPASLSDEEKDALGEWAERLAGREIWRAEGCPACLGGYRGRTGLYELLTVDEDIRNAIRSGAEIDSLGHIAREKGMRLLAEDAVEKVLGGVTTVAEMLRAVGRSEDVVHRG